MLNDITDIIHDRGQEINRDDLEQILIHAVDVPLAQSDDLASAMAAIALVVSMPEYDGDIQLSDLN